MELSNLFYFGAFLKNAGLIAFGGASILVIYIAFRDRLKRGLYAFLFPYHLYYSMERMRHPWKKQINKVLFGGFFAFLAGIIFTDILSDSQQLALALLKGITTGSFYALMAFAIILIFKTTDLVNFAQADMVTVSVFFLITILGGFSDQFLTTYPSEIAMVYGLAILIMILFAGGFGALTEMVFIKPIQKQHPISQIILTLGLSMFFMGISGVVLWDQDPHTLPNIIGRDVYRTSVYEDIKTKNNAFAGEIKNIIVMSSETDIKVQIDGAVEGFKNQKNIENIDMLSAEIEKAMSYDKLEQFSEVIDKISGLYSYGEDSKDIKTIVQHLKNVKNDLSDVRVNLEKSIETAQKLANLPPKEYKDVRDSYDAKTKAIEDEFDKEKASVEASSLTDEEKTIKLESLQKNKTKDLMGVYSIDTFASEKEGEMKIVPPSAIIKFTETVTITKDGLLAVGVTLIIMLIIFLLFKYTLLGIALRATAQSQNTSKLMGINVDKVFIFSWVVSITLASIAALFFAIATDMRTNILTFSFGNLMLKGFSAAVLGGFSSLPGAVLGGFLLGIFDNILSYTDMREVLSFGIILAVLIIKPDGLFGHSGAKKV